MTGDAVGSVQHRIVGRQANDGLTVGGLLSLAKELTGMEINPETPVTGTVKLGTKGRVKSLTVDCVL